MNRLITFLVVLMTLLAGCVSTSNLFQDGRTAGKDRGQVVLSASYSMVPDHELDEANQHVALTPHKVVSPWLQVQGQYGVQERLDLGGSIGFGLFSIGGQLYSKVALTPNDAGINISLLGLAGIAGLDEEVLEDSDHTDVFYYNFLAALPISFHLDKQRSLVVQPMVARDNFRYDVPGSTAWYRGRLNDTSYRLGFGYIQSNDKKHRTFYNLTLSYTRLTNQIHPTFGIGFIPAW